MTVQVLYHCERVCQTCTGVALLWEGVWDGQVLHYCERVCETRTGVKPLWESLSEMYRCCTTVREYVRHAQVLHHCEGVCQTCTGVAPLWESLSDMYRCCTTVRVFVLLVMPLLFLSMFCQLWGVCGECQPDAAGVEVAAAALPYHADQHAPRADLRHQHVFHWQYHPQRSVSVHTALLVNVFETALLVNVCETALLANVFVRQLYLRTCLWDSFTCECVCETALLVNVFVR